MKKIINAPADVPIETIEGFLEAYGRQYERVAGVKAIRRKAVPDKVAFVIGGGSGHEPLFGMFVGENLADAAACGNIFASPDPNTILQAALSVHKGKGVLFVYGNYAGDNMNFDMAAEMLEDMGVQSRTVRVWDDVASAPKERTEDRRGIAGDVFVIKIGGAATGAGLDLDEACRVTAKARDNVFSIGVALSGGTIPGESGPSFTLPDDEIEFGMGVHGEPGIMRMKITPADEIADILLDKIIEDSGIKAGDCVCTLVNGLGSTTLAELHIMNRRLAGRLREKGMSIHDMEVNSFITTQEMAGASVTLFRLDDELKEYYDMPCWSPYYSKRRI
jgi:dihydroxyacetone kinase